MSKNCPVCGASGDDLVFTFACTNPECQNFAPERQRDVDDEDVESLLKSLWVIYQRGETLEEFIREFFAHGGRVDRSPDSTEIDDARITEPEWLRRRIHDDE
jgi:hypothetical protein